MATKPVSLQEKKLNTLRNILWVCFAGIAIIVILLGVGALGAFSILANTIETSAEEAAVVTMTYPALIITVLVLVGGVGAVCLVIYQIFKYRLEKDEELFL